MCFNYIHARFARIEAHKLIELWAFHKFRYKFKGNDSSTDEIYKLLDIACEDCKSKTEEQTNNPLGISIGKQNITKCVNYLKEKENDKKDIT